MTKTQEGVLVIEDDHATCELICYHLARAGFSGIAASTGEDGLKVAFERHPKLVILDLILPGMDGFDVCRRLRQDDGTAGIPVIMLSARDTESDVIAGLELGADYYLTKPFSIRVLISRVRTLLRRVGRVSTDRPGEPLSVGGIAINPGHHEVRVDDQPVKLTPTEFDILHLLAGHPGHVFHRDDILQRIRGSQYRGSERAIDVQMVGLRKRLGKYGKQIQTVRGVGYRLSPSQGTRGG